MRWCRSVDMLMYYSGCFLRRTLRRRSREKLILSRTHLGQGSILHFLNNERIVQIGAKRVCLSLDECWAKHTAMADQWGEEQAAHFAQRQNMWCFSVAQLCTSASCTCRFTQCAANSFKSNNKTIKRESDLLLDESSGRKTAGAAQGFYSCMFTWFRSILQCINVHFQLRCQTRIFSGEFLQLAPPPLPPTASAIAH